MWITDATPIPCGMSRETTSLRAVVPGDLVKFTIERHAGGLDVYADRADDV